MEAVKLELAQPTSRSFAQDSLVNIDNVSLRMRTAQEGVVILNFIYTFHVAKVCRFFFIEFLKIYLIDRNVSLFENRKKVLNHSTLNSVPTAQLYDMTGNNGR